MSTIYSADYWKAEFEAKNRENQKNEESLVAAHKYSDLLLKENEALNSRIEALITGVELVHPKNNKGLFGGIAAALMLGSFLNGENRE
jgi:hypothetical protein